MQAVRIDELELFEAWSQRDTGMRVRAGFLISSGTGTVFADPMEPFGTRYFTTPMIEEEATVTAA